MNVCRRSHRALKISTTTTGCGMIRCKLLKIGGRLRQSVRRVWLSLSEAYPNQAVFERVLLNLQRRQPHPLQVQRPAATKNRTRSGRAAASWGEATARRCRPARSSHPESHVPLPFAQRTRTAPIGAHPPPNKSGRSINLVRYAGSPVDRVFEESVYRSTIPAGYAKNSNSRTNSGLRQNRGAKTVAQCFEDAPFRGGAGCCESAEWRYIGCSAIQSPAPTSLR